jgi:ABC-type spermidine/putrescine transport system permease subunit II
MNADIIEAPEMSAVLLFAAGMLLGGIPSMAVWSDRFTRLRIQRRAARTLGASGWRIFWRVMLPAAWLQISLAILMATAAAELIRLAVA